MLKTIVLSSLAGLVIAVDWLRFEDPRSTGERMRRLIEMVANGRIDLTPLVTHDFSLEDLPKAYELFSRQGDGVLKVAVFPNASRARPGAPRSETVSV